jgi:hypothetical protein
MVQVKQIGNREFLYIGNDMIKVIPIDQIKDIEYRNLHCGSWVQIKMNDGELHFWEDCDAATEEIIKWLEKENN